MLLCRLNLQREFHTLIFVMSSHNLTFLYSIHPFTSAYLNLGRSQSKEAQSPLSLPISLAPPGGDHGPPKPAETQSLQRVLGRPQGLILVGKATLPVRRTSPVNISRRLGRTPVCGPPARGQLVIPVQPDTSRRG